MNATGRYVPDESIKRRLNLVRQAERDDGTIPNAPPLFACKHTGYLKNILWVGSCDRSGAASIQASIMWLSGGCPGRT